MKVLVVAATSWGCTLAACAHRAGHDASVLCRSESEAATLTESRELTRLMPGVLLPDEIAFVTEPSGPPPGVVIWAAPSQRLRGNLRTVLPMLTPGDTVHVSAAKGLERGSHQRMTEVLDQELNLAGRDARVGAVSGPNIAREIAAGLPAATVAAAADESDRERIQHALNSTSFRVYTNPDVIGVELGGALKNIIVIAAGAASALRLGDNARAALLTRGLSEIARMGVRLGAEPSTFAGLAGLGDLLVTAMSPRSRNRSFGERIGAGVPTTDALADTANVVEGVETVQVALEMAEALGEPMPISTAVSDVLFAGLDAHAAIRALMERAPTVEG